MADYCYCFCNIMFKSQGPLNNNVEKIIIHLIYFLVGTILVFVGAVPFQLAGPLNLKNCLVCSKQ